MPTINSRRNFLKSSVAASSALAAMAVPRTVHAGVDETLRLGLVGCGGRGTGAALNALHADPHTKLVALGDTFRDRAEKTLIEVKHDAEVADRAAVDEDHIFSDFDNYKHVIDACDVVLLATPPYFRPMHLAYAVEQGKHSFVEKPIAVDVPGVHAVMATCDLAKQKGLAVVSGLCWRYDLGVRETIARIQDGAIGDVIAIESSYNANTLWHRGNEPDWSRLEYQIRNWLYYTWLSGDHICEQAIHSLDKTVWVQGDASPSRAMALGGRQQRTDPKFGHIWDHFSVFYEYPSGIRVFFTCRQQDNCTTFVDDYVLGTKGKAQILANEIDGEKKWRYRGPKPVMYRQEHVELFKSIRDGQPINNGGYMCNSTLVAIMGRLAGYTGKTLTWEELNSSQERLGPTELAWGDVPEPPVAIPGQYAFV